MFIDGSTRDYKKPRRFLVVRVHQGSLKSSRRILLQIIDDTDSNSLNEFPEKSMNARDRPFFDPRVCQKRKARD